MLRARYNRAGGFFTRVQAARGSSATPLGHDVAVDAVDAEGNAVDKRKAFFSVRDANRKHDERVRDRSEKDARDREREAMFRARLLEYRDSVVDDAEAVEDIAFEPDLTSYERRMVHVICDEIGLGHMSVMGSDGVRVLMVTKHPGRMAEWTELTADIRKAANERKDEEKRRRKEEREAAKIAAANLGNGGSPPTSGSPALRSELEGIKWFKPRSAIVADGEAVSAANAIKVPQYKVYVPPRQPTGPDGTIGFASRKLAAGIIDAAEEECQQHSPAQTALKTAASQTPLNPSVPPFTPSAAAYAT